MVRHSPVCTPHPAGTAPQHTAGPIAHSSARRSLDSPGICDQLQFPGAQETQIQQYRDSRGEEGEQELQLGSAGRARRARGWRVMVENEATEHLLHRRLLLCAREASPALHGSVLSSARPHPAQPTVSHAVTPRLCNCQRGRGRAAGTAASHLRPRDPAPTPPRSSLPPGRSRRRGFLGHRGYARNAAASSQMQSSCPGTASPRPDRGESRAHPGLGQGKGSQEEAESPESHRCPPGHSTAHPVPTARGLHGLLSCLSPSALCGTPLWEGCSALCPLPPPCLCCRATKPVLRLHQTPLWSLAQTEPRGSTALCSLRASVSLLE